VQNVSSAIGISLQLTRPWVTSLATTNSGVAMKQFLGLCLLLWAMITTTVAHGQTAKARLNPQSPSHGYGEAIVNLVGPTLSVDIYFARLDATSATGVILCCNSDPAKAVPATANLIDSIKGDDHGSLVTDFLTSDSGFWDSTFLGAGTVDSARARLSAALTSGQAHIAVTSTAYSVLPGEISGAFANPATMISMRNPRKIPYGYTLIQPDGKATIVSTGNPYMCSNASERCVFPVYVSFSTDVSGQVSCEARIDFGSIVVPPHKETGKTIRVIWQLVEGNIGDLGDYRFMDAGIELNKSKNDVRKDFNGKGKDSADAKRFKWLRVGVRTGNPIDYWAYVERFDTATGTSRPCRPADPTIANTN
jgi:hypothetical protein